MFKGFGRLRRAARLAYHAEYGAYLPAVFRSQAELQKMNLSKEEEAKVDLIVAWMLKQVLEKDYWF